MRLAFESGEPFWRFEAAEYPVTAINSRQTRIDLVMANCQSAGTFLAVECKRANPDYKCWALFDRTPATRASGQDDCYIESQIVWQRPRTGPNTATHKIDRIPMEGGVRAFNYYLECKVDKNGKSSSTETIEDALSQATFGQSGLMQKLIALHEHSLNRCIPVVITTAQLVEAQFDVGKVLLDGGRIGNDDVTFRSLEFAAVNFRASDELAVPNSAFARSTVTGDIVGSQMRSVFVVQAASVSKFLRWSNEALTRLAA